MAIKLSTDTAKDIRAQVNVERLFAFKVISIILIIGCIGFVGWSGFSIYRAIKYMDESETRISELKNSYEAIQAEAKAWHESNDRKITDADSDGVVLSKIQMPSAKLAGDEVAELQNEFYKDASGSLSYEDSMRFAELVKGDFAKSCWYGSELKPGEHDLKWEFVTWYDSSPVETATGSVLRERYDCVWNCWYTAPSGEKYLVASVVGVYNGKGDIDNNTPGTGYFDIRFIYNTDFGRMLTRTGSIEPEPIVAEDGATAEGTIEGQESTTTASGTSSGTAKSDVSDLLESGVVTGVNNIDVADGTSIDDTEGTSSEN